MSNLNSKFDLIRGWPHGSALAQTFVPKYDETLEEGHIVTTYRRQRPDAVVLKMIDDSAGGGSPPVGPSAGDAYVVNTWGAGYNDGDIVEYDGSSWVVIVANAGGVPAADTTVVVTDSGAAGTFNGDEESVYVYSGGWSKEADASEGDRVLITSGVYGGDSGLYYDYKSSAWSKASQQFRARASVKLASCADRTGASATDNGGTTEPWMVIQGNDQPDGSFISKVDCIKMKSGAIVRVPVSSAKASAWSIGDAITATSGVLEKYDVGVQDGWPLGIVIDIDTDENWVDLATFYA